MILRRLISYLLGWLAARLTWRFSRSNCQIFVINAFSAIVHFDRSILPLTDQCLGLRRPIAFILRLELQKMPPVLHHPIIADPSFRL
jgi:hypothetical protein